jgi:DNA-binding NtrC family response regulator
MSRCAPPSATYSANPDIGRDARKMGSLHCGRSDRRFPTLCCRDLNMPGMSGLEFLFVVRRRFPNIGVIAMSGAFSGNVIPPGGTADAFLEKGADLDSLKRIVETITRMNKSPSYRTATPPGSPRDCEEGTEPYCGGGSGAAG